MSYHSLVDSTCLLGQVEKTYITSHCVTTPNPNIEITLPIYKCKH